MIRLRIGHRYAVNRALNYAFGLTRESDAQRGGQRTRRRCIKRAMKLCEAVSRRSVMYARMINLI